MIVANEQHLYLKACDYKERQKWLVALASQKATSSAKNVVTNPVMLPNNGLKLSDLLLKSGDDSTENSSNLNNSFQKHLSKVLFN